LIFISLTFSTTSLCILIPPSDLNLISGLIDSFKVFFTRYDMIWAYYIIGCAMILGTLGVASSWIIGLTRTLYVVLKDSNVLPFFHLKNKYDIPVRILLVQGAVFTVLLALYEILPSVQYAYWILQTITSQYTVVYYVILFLAVLKLRKRRLGSLDFMNVIGPAMAIFICIVGFVVGYFPTSAVNGPVVWFEIELIGGQIIFALPVLWIWLKKDTTVTPKEIKGVNEILF